MTRAKAGLTRLVVCDAHDASWIERAVSVSGPADEWHILLVGVSEPRYRQVCAVDLGRLPQATVLDTTLFAPAVHTAVRDYVLRLAFELPGTDIGGQTIAEILRERGGNLWWSLVVSEKSAFRGPLIERLFRLALIEQALAGAPYAEVWLRLSDAHLAAVLATAEGMPRLTMLTRVLPRTFRDRIAASFVLAYWLRAAAAAAQVLWIRGIATLAGWRSEPAERGGLAVFTHYPYWWLNAFDDGAADRFFSAPPLSRAPYYIAWMRWPGRLWANRKRVGQVLRAHRIVPLQSRLGLLDTLAVLRPSRFTKLARIHRRLPAIRARFLRFDVSRIVQDELRASLANAELMMDDLLERAVRRLVREEQPSAIAYRCENQPWEAAVIAAAGPQRTIGFFHAPFGNYTAFRLAAGDLEAGPPRGAGPRPVPGGMLVCGEAGATHLTADGYPASRIAACGPQRHASFIRFLARRPDCVALRQRLGLPLDVPVYFVAIAIVEVETEGLFACLDTVVAGDRRSHLVVKTHPNRPMGDEAMRRAIESAGQVRTSIIPPAADMYEYLAASNAMITVGSTVAFEAMALGVMPVVYEHPGTYAVTSLRDFERALFVVNSPQSLRDALDAISGHTPEAVRRRAEWPWALRQVFGDLDTSLPEQMDRALTQLGHAP